MIFDVVNKLTFSLRGKNFWVFMDNLYTSIPLLQFLHRHKIFGCGTMRSNRKYLPQQIKKPPRLQRGESITFQDVNFTPLTVTAWEDTRTVRFASCLSQPSLLTNTVRRINGQYCNIGQPHVASQYGQFYKGVDIFDSLTAKYKTGHSSKKVWKFILWFSLNAFLANSWLVFKSVKGNDLPKNYDQMKFRHRVAKGLIGTISHRQRSAQVANTRKSDDHRNVHMRAKRARYCYAHKDFQPDGKQKYETVYGCLSCGVHLCKSCHVRFHANE